MLPTGITQKRVLIEIWLSWSQLNSDQIAQKNRTKDGLAVRKEKENFLKPFIQK